MLECLDDSIVKAQKEYICDYCSQKIAKGEKHHRAYMKFDNEMYTWRSHLKCAELAVIIRDVVNPDEGLTHDDFSEGVQILAEEFVCAACQHFDKEYPDDCGEWMSKDCVNTVCDFFQHHKLYWDGGWKVKESEVGK